MIRFPCTIAHTKFWNPFVSLKQNKIEIEKDDDVELFFAKSINKKNQFIDWKIPLQGNTDNKKYF